MATKRQIAANRKNALKGGPNTPEGKAVSRLNARSHGIFASALTDDDHEELHGLYDSLADEVRPEGPLEDMLTEMLALTYLRMQRCARAEGEYHVRTCRVVTEYLDVLGGDYVERCLDGGQPIGFRFSKFERSLELFARYNTSLTNQTLRLMHEIDRLQRARRGEQVPAPLAADVTVHLEEGEPGPTDADAHAQGEAIPGDADVEPDAIVTQSAPAGAGDSNALPPGRTT